MNAPKKNDGQWLCAETLLALCDGDKGFARRVIEEADELGERVEKAGQPGEIGYERLLAADTLLTLCVGNKQAALKAMDEH